MLLWIKQHFIFVQEIFCNKCCNEILERDENRIISASSLNIEKYIFTYTLFAKKNLIFFSGYKQHEAQVD